MNRLLQRAQRGDIRAFAELFEPLREHIHAVACRWLGEQEAEDIVMETFLRAWKALPGFRGTASLKTWVLRIAHNACLDRLRRPQVARTVSLDQLSDTDRKVSEPWDVTSVPPDEELHSKDSVALLRRALARLDDLHRRILVLRYVDGFSYTEIAAALGIPLGTVMSRLFNARRKLRKIWDELENAGASP